MWRSSVGPNGTSAAASTTCMSFTSGSSENSPWPPDERTDNGHSQRKGPIMADCANSIRVPALEIKQGPARTLYSFAIDGKMLPKFAAVSRIQRDDDAQINGYQRPEVLSHIASIRRYLESEDAMLPNALVVAFDHRVKFEPRSDSDAISYAHLGELLIPVNDAWTEAEKPGWIVDGQQRSAAIRDARIDEFPVCVTAFVTDSDAEQRSQFILVNSTKPLPKGLIYELLPATSGILPTPLQTRRFPAYLLDRL